MKVHAVSYPFRKLFITVIHIAPFLVVLQIERGNDEHKSIIRVTSCGGRILDSRLFVSVEILASTTRRHLSECPLREFEPLYLQVLQVGLVYNYRQPTSYLPDRHTRMLFRYSNIIYQRCVSKSSSSNVSERHDSENALGGHYHSSLHSPHSQSND